MFLGWTLTPRAGRRPADMSWLRCAPWIRWRWTSSLAEGSVQKWSDVFSLVYSRAQGPTEDIINEFTLAALVMMIIRKQWWNINLSFNGPHHIHIFGIWVPDLTPGGRAGVQTGSWFEKHILFHPPGVAGESLCSFHLLSVPPAIRRLSALQPGVRLLMIPLRFSLLGCLSDCPRVNCTRTLIWFYWELLSAQYNLQYSPRRAAKMGPKTESCIRASFS